MATPYSHMETNSRGDNVKYFIWLKSVIKLIWCVTLAARAPFRSSTLVLD